ncbi:MAG TPA: Fe-S cluster assembly protein SufB [Spirochaetales bacterium]|nr:Fe-S cluster assembly protein SufB [Spirochaetales bacterium]HPS14411.1 Fe-S cluster assembly protein SufB [Spirochaetales bacterium]
MVSDSDIRNIGSGYAERFGFAMPERSILKTQTGLTEETVREISKAKDEPDWMLQFRLNAFHIYEKKPLPTWGADLSKLDFEGMTYYSKPTEKPQTSWEALPAEIKNTYERLGVPEAERSYLAGVGAQYDSEMVYHNIREDLKKKGIIFADIETAEHEYPELLKRYFATVVPPSDNKFAALNSAVWSGGSFIYVPPHVHVDIPLQAYFRVNSQAFGQFERTLIIADEGSFVHYIEGCTAPIFSTDSLHAAVVEIIALPYARIRYSTVQNWSGNMYNLVTKRAFAYDHAIMEWVDGNIGSKVTMKYPAIFLKGEGARGEVLSIAFAGKGQEQDTGAKIFHLASNTSSVVNSKSISKDGGTASYRGMVKVAEGLTGIRSKVECDALILDSKSKSNTYPTMDIRSEHAAIEHEAKVSRISEEQLFYLMTRGLSESEAATMIVNGFVDPLVKELPMEYAVELNRLIELEMEGSVG